jgi:hypothetical protein
MSEQPGSDLSRLRALAEAATSGPWAATTETDGASAISRVMRQNVCIARTQPMFGRPHAFFREIEHNATFIAACDPQTILALLDRAERAEAEVAELKDATDDQIEQAALIAIVDETGESECKGRREFCPGPCVCRRSAQAVLVVVAPLIRAAERERCAKIVEEAAGEDDSALADSAGGALDAGSHATMNDRLAAFVRSLSQPSARATRHE